jgi:hypothetical protein
MPIIVTATIRDGGPSIDFILGRLFDYSQERTVKEIGDIVMESPLAIDSWRFDEELQKSKGNILFPQRHCNIVGY